MLPTKFKRGKLYKKLLIFVSTALFSCVVLSSFITQTNILNKAMVDFSIPNQRSNKRRRDHHGSDNKNGTTADDSISTDEDEECATKSAYDTNNSTSSEQTDGIIIADATLSISRVNSNADTRDPNIDTLPVVDQSSKYTKCMLELEQLMYPRIWELREARNPIPHSVKIIDGHFHVLLLIYHVGGIWVELSNATKILCNDSVGGTLLGHQQDIGLESIVIQCPAVVNPVNSILSVVSIVTVSSSKEGNTGGNNGTYTFENLEKFDECERIDIDYFKHNPILGGRRQNKEEKAPLKERHIKIGATITIRNSIKDDGEKNGAWGNVRKQALEWAEYHHLIGVDHMWIYINEAWNGGRDLPHRKYITWIPFNWCLYNYNNWTKFPYDQQYTELFRGASQTDALWRARRAGMDWIAIVDVDEYIQVSPSDAYSHFYNHSNVTKACPTGGCIPTNKTDPAVIDALSRYLINLTVSDSLGIRLESIPYGRNTALDQIDDNNLVIDNVWRKKGAVQDSHYHMPEKLNRRKGLLIPHMVVSWFIHDIVTSTIPIPTRHNISGGLMIKEASEIRVNHYKQTKDGVHWKNRQMKHPVEDIEQESYLKDNFHDLIIAAIKEDSSK